MPAEPKWRLSSEYLGAGKFLALDNRLFVCTKDGVECLEPGRNRLWKTSLGSRCLGVVGIDEDVSGEEHDAVMIATCRQGLFFLDRDGRRRREVHSLRKEEELVHTPVQFASGLVLPTREALLHVHETGGPGWRLDFRTVLGKSVEAVRPIDLFRLEELLVIGVVDYDSGIGRVMVVDSAGSPTWMSEPGPVTDVFPAGKAVFVWCQSGYGKFETQMNRLDGHEIWRHEFAGMGNLRPDGSIVMLVGTNESPAWDDWELRVLSAGGKVETTTHAHGRCPVRSLCLDDGTLYFVGNLQRIDPSDSRTDYTSFFAQPQEVVFQHMMGIRPQLRECEVYFQRALPGGEIEILAESTGSYSFGEPQLLGNLVVFSDASDLIAFSVEE